MEKQNLMEPFWWTETHSDVWHRVKEALKRDWEQTKADLSQNDEATPGYLPPPHGINGGGTDLKQTALDTLHQALGSMPIPPPAMPNPKAFSDVAPAYRYGVGLGFEYGAERDWTAELEIALEVEWRQLGPSQPWDEVRADVQHGFEQGRRIALKQWQASQSSERRAPR